MFRTRSRMRFTRRYHYVNGLDPRGEVKMSVSGLYWFLILMAWVYLCQYAMDCGLVILRRDSYQVEKLSWVLANWFAHEVKLTLMVLRGIHHYSRCTWCDKGAIKSWCEEPLLWMVFGGFFVLTLFVLSSLVVFCYPACIRVTIYWMRTVYVN